MTCSRPQPTTVAASGRSRRMVSLRARNSSRRTRSSRWARVGSRREASSRPSIARAHEPPRAGRRRRRGRQSRWAGLHSRRAALDHRHPVGTTYQPKRRHRTGHQPPSSTPSGRGPAWCVRWRLLADTVLFLTEQLVADRLAVERPHEGTSFTARTALTRWPVPAASSSASVAAITERDWPCTRHVAVRQRQRKEPGGEHKDH